MDKEWIEIRSWPGHEEEESMLEIVYYLYNSDEPCEFVAANMELEGENGSEIKAEKGVRYFLGLPSGSKEVVMERLEGLKYDVREGPKRKPPSPSDYEMEAELEAKRHYGVPFLEGITRLYGRDSFDDRPDISGSLVSALSSGGAVRMAFSRSDRARRGAHKQARDLAERAKKRSEADGHQIGSQVLFGKTHDGRPENSGWDSRTARDQELEERAERWRDRADSGMFACDARVYGGSRGQVERLAAVFPFRPNSFRISRTERGDGENEAPEPDPEVPLPYKLREFLPLIPLGFSLLALVWLSGGLQDGLMAIAGIAGSFPQCLLQGETYILLSGLAGTLAWFARNTLEGNHLALSIPELSLVVSIPEKLARFGEKGQEPASRTGSFSFEEEMTGKGVVSEEGLEALSPEPEKEGGEQPLEEGKAKPEKQEKEGEEVQEVSEEQEEELITAPIGEPTRIAGTLYDPSTGKELSNVKYEVLMDGDPYYSGETEEDASYSFMFTPPGPGLYTLSVSLKGYPEVGEEITVDSTPRAGEPETKPRAEQEHPEKPEDKSEKGREGRSVAEQSERFSGKPPAAKYEVNEEEGGES